MGWNFSPWKSMKWWKSHIFACKSMILGDCGDDQDFMPLFFISVIFCHPTPIESWNGVNSDICTSPDYPDYDKDGLFHTPYYFFSTGSEKKSFKNFIPLNFFISLDTVGKVIENFAPLKISRKIFVPLKFPGKIFRPLKKYSDRVSGVKNDRPLMC